MIVPGRSIGNFRVLRLIGEGGFGEVYEAENPLIQRRVAIKVLHGGLVKDPELVRRFLNEARAASGIHHPNIVEVFDAGISPEREPYIVMEYLDGTPLHQVIADQGKLGLGVVHEIARQACSALAAAHASGIVHRDLKPENLFVLQHPGSPLGLQVKVLDFGIAKIKQTSEIKTSVKTRTGFIMGSPAYMSPEQCKDSSDVDHRTDIYSMAVIVYEMLAGAPPFACESNADLLVMQLSSVPRPLRAQVPELPEHVEQAVMRALAKDRAARFSSIDYFVGALLGTHPVQTARGSAPLTQAELSARSRPQADDPAGAVRTVSGTAVLDPAAAPPPEATSAPRKPPEKVSTPADAAGGAGPPAGKPARQAHGARARSRSWRLLASTGAAAVVLLGLGVVLFQRSAREPLAPPTTSPLAAPAPTTVRLRIRSAPTGATVIDDRDGSTLGQTPLERSLPKSTGSIGLTLRLAGYQDEMMSLALDADASALVNLRAVPGNTPLEAEPAVRRPASKPGPSPARRPAKPTPTDDEWVAH